jgi:ADP-ribose pyrophosphatase YjhB (NUDIX family)
MTKRCDNASVGVLAERKGRWLFVWRNTFPFSVAPVSGHVFDEHRCYDEAARAEMREEAGLEVESLYLTPAGGWRPNRCRREPGPAGTGHLWEVYTATVSGELAPSQREVKQARWLGHAQVQLLANRTMLYAQNRVPEDEWRDSPGIEPVWVGFLADLDLVRMPVENLDLVARHAAEGRPLVL